MEHQEVCTLKAEHRLEVEMPKASKEDDTRSKPRKYDCNSICSFSKKEYNTSALEERSKSTVKLSGLITFYVIVMAVEVVGGVKANSLAVLTDAAHLLSDIAGFSISLFTVWASGWEPTSEHSFGFNRLEVLGALLSVQLIWLISGILFYEALDRILHKNAKVNGELMFAIAAFGFIINFIMVVWLGHGHNHSHNHDHSQGHGHDDDHSQLQHICTDKDHNHEGDKLCQQNEEERTTLVSSSAQKSRMLNINIQGAYLHVMTDLIQSVGVMIAGLVIWVKPDWLVVDLVCTLVFSAFALATTLPMLRSICCILMERTPSEIDVAHLAKDLICIEGVLDVHDLHVWAITIGKVVLACHVVVEAGADSNEILQKVKENCERTYRIHHVTIQIEQRS
ncbi:hypothetical protein RJ639_003505 [Escallonia herrerae]|uniref:Uncharacterized protein n=1 Tax=Escallonia herrerae TaxID=1293975 RepID=A0AA88VZZ6_9ASTE|nr:hypothetical protein RJ639_003505 [Escallonia herrerae]